MKIVLKTVSVILAAALAVTLTIALLFGCFGASLDAAAQSRITSDASGWQTDNGGFAFDAAMRLVNSAFENRLVYICAGIIMLLAAVMIAVSREKSLLYAGVSAVVSGFFIALTGLVLNVIFTLLDQAVPLVDWEWYSPYLSAFRGRLMLSGALVLALGITLIVIGAVAAKKAKKN